MGDIHTPPRFTWTTGAWDSEVASQTATHFQRQQLVGIANSYKFVQRLEEFARPEIEIWNTLYTMSGPGRRLEPASEAELRKALSNARTTNLIYLGLSSRLIDSINSLHLPFSGEDLKSMAAASQPSPSQCEPIGPVPAFYGQGIRFRATLSNGEVVTLADAEKALKLMPREK